MEISKVEFLDRVLIDLSNDTVEENKLLVGITAHNSAGEPITGNAPGAVVMVEDDAELLVGYDNYRGFKLSYINADTGQTFATNSVKTNTGIYIETADTNAASAWFLEHVSNNRFYIYTYSGGSKVYMYNTSGNLMSLDTTNKTAFDITQEDPYKFIFKVYNANKWLQHSKSANGIRLYTDHTNLNNSQLSLTYIENAIVPNGTLTITENGTYDISKYESIIVNIE